MTKGYWSTKDLSERYRRSSRTIFRWMKLEDKPFPPPRLKFGSGPNLWLIEDVENWEAICVHREGVPKSPSVMSCK